MILRPADQRFHSQLNWLDSWNSFSFGSHQDPNWMGFGPLRVINDDTIAAGQGFGMHPHRDIEIITVKVEGVLTHADSIGNSAVLHAAEERWLWLQVIDGELTLTSEGSPKQSLQRGDGVGLIQDAATQSELIGLSERADVLLFALA